MNQKLMNQKLMDLLYEEDHDFCLLSFMRKLMCFFNYQARFDSYYCMGDGLLLTIPFIMDEEGYFQKCFQYVSSVCYYSGAWEDDYITEDCNSFCKTLKDKWFEWADRSQIMPFVVVLKKDYLVDFYVLVGYENQDDEFLFFDKNRNVVRFSNHDIKNTYDEYGFASIDIPFNFLSKSDYYRKEDRSNIGILQKIGQRLDLCMENSSVFVILRRLVEENELKEALKLLRGLFNRANQRGVPDTLFRDKLGCWCVANGFHEIGQLLIRLGEEWSLLDSDISEEQKSEIVRDVLALEAEVWKKLKVFNYEHFA